MRRGAVTCIAAQGDGLALLHHVTHLHQGSILREVDIGGDAAIAMANVDEVLLPIRTIAIHKSFFHQDYLSRTSGDNRGADRHQEVVRELNRRATRV